MHRFLTLAFFAGLAVFLLRQGYLLFVSDEAKIRSVIERAVNGYNAGLSRQCVGDVSEDWLHSRARHGEPFRPSGVDRKKLSLGLRGLFFQDRDSRNGELHVRVSVPAETVLITVDGSYAEFRCEARFERRRGTAWSQTWRIALDVELVEVDGEGWQIVKTWSQTLEGKPPSY